MRMTCSPSTFFVITDKTKSKPGSMYLTPQRKGLGFNFKIIQTLDKIFHLESHKRLSQDAKKVIIT